MAVHDDGMTRIVDNTAEFITNSNPFPTTLFGNSQSPLIDAFSRQRVSNPHTIFDSKQIFPNSEIVSGENQPLFFDNQEVSGGGTSTVYSVDRASTILSVSDTTAGKRVRQTKMRFNYQPGKSQLIYQTMVIGNGGSGITKRIGFFDDDNGIFFEQSNSDLYFVIRSSVSGSPVDTKISQQNWNIDKLNGVGQFGKTLDISKAQILVFDFEWLGVGSVRGGFIIDGQLIYFHQFKNANNLTSVYMSTPNLPIRVEIENDGSGSANSIEQNCSSLISEGGIQPLGQTRSLDPTIWYNSITQASIVGTTYPVVGFRLKSNRLGDNIIPENITALSASNDDFIVSLHLNPTLSSSPTWVNINESALQYALTTTTTLTAPGYITNSFLANANTAITVVPKTIVRLGAFIDGTPDEMWVCVTPLSINLDINAMLTWQEIS